MTDTLPKSRLFYRLVDGRMLSSKALLLSELIDPKLQTKIGRTPFTRSQVMSRENLDPRTYAFVTVYTTVVAARDARLLRVVGTVVAAPAGGTVPTFTPPAAPHADGHSVGRVVGIEVGDQVVAATIVDVSLDTDQSRKYVVEVPDPTPPDESAGRGDLALVLIERATEVVKQNVKVQWITMTTENGAPNIVPTEHRVKIKSISAMRPWGGCVGMLPIDNTVNGRFLTRNLPGLVTVQSLSDNHFSSSQVGRDGIVRMAIVSKTEDVALPDGTVTRQKVTRKWLSWSPPESTVFGTPVDVSAATGGAECDFDLPCLFTADDGAGGTFPKMVKLSLHVNADLLPDKAADESVSVQTTFRKTPDGRPILGQTTVPPGLDLLTVPTWSILDGHPDAPVKGDPILNSKNVKLDGVDDQGVSPWHKVSRPVFPGRTYPTAVFERWYTVPAPSNASADQILQKTTAVPDHEFDVWIVPIPTPELLAYLQQLGILRPTSREPTSPDEKVYPYQEATPQDLDTDPTTLMPDKVMAVLEKYLDSSGQPSFPDPVNGIPWFRDPTKIYYIFVIRVGDINEALVNAQRRFTGQAQFDDGPLDPATGVAQFPVATHLSGSKSSGVVDDTGRPIEDGPHQPVNARVTVSSLQPGLTQSLLFVYPRKFSPAKASGPGDALRALGTSCGDQSKDPMAQADLIALARKS